MIQKNKTLVLMIIFVVIFGVVTACNGQSERNDQDFIPEGTAMVEQLPTEPVPGTVREETVLVETVPGTVVEENAMVETVPEEAMPNITEPVETPTEATPEETLPAEYHPTEDTNVDCNDDPSENYNYNNHTTRERAPQLRMLDMDYNEVQLSDFYGKPIVLHFWASWCAACMRSSPTFNALYQQRHEMISDFHLLMVNILCGSRETLETLDYYLSSNNYTFPVFLDTQSGFRAFGVTSIPTTIFICAHGYIIPVYGRMFDIESINNGIASALNCGCV